MKKIISVLTAIALIAAMLSVCALADEGDSGCTLEAVILMHPYENGADYCVTRFCFSFGAETVSPDAFEGGFEAWWGTGEIITSPLWATEEQLASGVQSFTDCVASWEYSSWFIDELTGNWVMECHFDIPGYNAGEEYAAAKEGKFVGYLCENTVECDGAHLVSDASNLGMPDLQSNYEMNDNQYMTYDPESHGAHDAIVLTVQTAEDYYASKGVTYTYETAGGPSESRAPETDGSKTDKSGCGSSVGFSALALAVLALPAVTKKH